MVKPKDALDFMDRIPKHRQNFFLGQLIRINAKLNPKFQITNLLGAVIYQHQLH